MISVLKATLVLVWMLPLLPAQIILIIFKNNYRFKLPCYFHKGLLFILGVKLKIKGSVAKNRPLILLGNHCSYLDIIILSSAASVCFVAKEEIKNWFLFGFLAKLQNTIFISRRNRNTINSIYKINSEINKNFSMVLFPEATTGNGKNILKFKSSLYSVFERNPIIKLQNFSLCYTHINSMPLDNRLRPKVAWYGDMNMLGHLKKLLSISTINALITFHPQIDTSGLDRKKIRDYSRKQVIKGFYSSY